MNIKLIREETSSQGTFGTLYINDKPFCKTGELPVYAGNIDIRNEKQTDCIPKGTYNCCITNSPKFGKVYTVKNVPNRSHILIHSGNYCGDKSKGFKSNVEGCILLGKDVGVLNKQKVVLESKPTISNFIELMNGKPFTLTIEEIF